MVNLEVNIWLKNKILTRKQLSKLTGLHESKVQRILKYFENEHQIEQQTNAKFRIITICNWQIYQTSEQVSEHLLNNQQTASEQLVNTNKNDKNVKNEKNDKNYRGDDSSDEFSKIVERAMDQLVKEGVYSDD